MLAFMSAAAAVLAGPANASDGSSNAASLGIPSAYGPVAPAPAAKPPAKTQAGSERCETSTPSAQSREIIVCAIKPEGYRLNPDVMQAKRELRSGGRPVRRGQVPSGNNCATVGPMGCRGVPTINLLAVAATAGKIAGRLSKGEEVGSIFVTDPHPSEYQLYLEAKEAREKKEAEKKAAAEQSKTDRNTGEKARSDAPDGAGTSAAQVEPAQQARP